MTIRGTSHLTFLARDLDRAARLLVEGLGAKEVYDSKDERFSVSREKFFLLGGVWIAYMEANRSSARTGTWHSRWPKRIFPVARPGCALSADSVPAAHHSSQEPADPSQS